MGKRTLLGGVLAVAVMITGFWGIGSASAQEVAAGRIGSVQTQVAPRMVAVVAAVRIRDLMTGPERLAYRQAMAAARTPADQMRIRAEILEKLQQRALEHGTIMVIDSRLLPLEARSSGGDSLARPGLAARQESPVARALPPRAP